MPRQLGDEPAFAADEQLFRCLRADWIGVDGRANAEAIDLQGTSVDRGLFAGEPADCLTRGAAHFVAVGAIMFDDIPDQFSAPPAKASIALRTATTLIARFSFGERVTRVHPSRKATP